MSGPYSGAAVLLVAAMGCGGCSSAATSPREAHSAPTIASLSVAPSGKGLMSATDFTFTGEGVTDPGEAPLTYSWRYGDGAVFSSASPTASHVFANAGTFVVTLTATGPQGLSASSSATVVVGDVSGVWDVTCSNRSAEAVRLWPNFPNNFVVTLSQSGASLTGSLSGAGLARNFNLPGGASHPRNISFGVETISNVWANFDGDFYFRLVLDSSLSMSTSGAGGFYCGSSVARKR